VPPVAVHDPGPDAKLAGVEAPKAPPEAVAERIIAALAARQAIVFPDDASASAGSVYLCDPVKLEHLLAD
jgi:hypothetical protein